MCQCEMDQAHLRLIAPHFTNDSIRAMKQSADKEVSHILRGKGWFSLQLPASFLGSALTRACNISIFV